LKGFIFGMIVGAVIMYLQNEFGVINGLLP